MKDNDHLLSEMSKRPLSFRESAMLASNIRSIEVSKKLQEEEIERWAAGCPTTLDKVFHIIRIGFVVISMGWIAVVVLLVAIEDLLHLLGL